MKKGYPRGGWNQSPPEEINKKHKQIAKLREQGVKLTDIAKAVDVPYGSVLYAVYRKPNTMWQ